MSQPTSFGSPTGTMYDAPPGTGGGGVGVEVKDENILVLADATTLNFVGAGVQATDAGGNQADVTIPGGIQGVIVEDEGLVVDSTTTTINFVGGGVTATEVIPGEVQVTIPFNPDECPIVIGLGSSAGNGSTPDDPTPGFADAVAIGCGAQALDQDTVALGNADARGRFSVAIGTAANADGGQQVVIGRNATAHSSDLNDDSVAIGVSAQAGDGLHDTGEQNATVVGPNALSTGLLPTALGFGAHAFSDNATAVGEQAHAIAANALALGAAARGNGAGSVAAGLNAQSNGASTVAVGNGAITHDDTCIAVGESASASNIGSVSVGPATSATGTVNGDGDIGHSLAVGPSAAADLAGDVAVGWGAHATGGLGVAVGKNATVGVECVGIGHAPVATGSTATAIGDTANALGDDSISIGSQSAAHPTHGIAIGPVAVVAVGHDASVALGFNAQTDRANQIMLGEGQVVDIPGAGNGLALHSPDGTRWLLTVSNAGALVITATP